MIVHIDAVSKSMVRETLSLRRRRDVCPRGRTGSICGWSHVLLLVLDNALPG